MSAATPREAGTDGRRTQARARVLDAAAEAFMRGGFGATTIDDIAEEAGATKGLVYYHFRSKFDVFLAVYGEGMRRVRTRVEPHATGPGTGRARLSAMSHAHLMNLMTDLAYHHVVHQGVRAQDSPELRIRQRDALSALNELRGGYELMFREVVVEGIADGSLREVEPALATRTLLSSLNAVDVWFRRVDAQPESELEELAGRVVDVLVGGLGAAPSAR
ncbi:TetR/AcrR family transcriptional regulator [Nocardioides euryhalodurans]|uniref:TetR/AcrR family transcriptional regulator n=1 Tax=Nocardioides euryhalodurans TaxID=2518370 RepID=A0A4P7GMU0_9ACTN|nr:TetR/AcrR family transcriptional regulator [Nocardioides euryhalodurans]QBR93107.1 TetR/AcrR family transcriptional regulator [Nocardioides euryhalodurans]